MRPNGSSSRTPTYHDASGRRTPHASVSGQRRGSGGEQGIVHIASHGGESLCIKAGMPAHVSSSSDSPSSPPPRPPPPPHTSPSHAARLICACADRLISCVVVGLLRGSKAEQDTHKGVFAHQAARTPNPIPSRSESTSNRPSHNPHPAGPPHPRCPCFTHPGGTRSACRRPRAQRPPWSPAAGEGHQCRCRRRCRRRRCRCRPCSRAP